MNMLGKGPITTFRGSVGAEEGAPRRPGIAANKRGLETWDVIPLAEREAGAHEGCSPSDGVGRMKRLPFQATALWRAVWCRIEQYLPRRGGVVEVKRPYTISVREDGSLRGMVAVVTGGSGTIGRAIACRLAAEGARIYVGGTNEANVAGVVSEIEELGGTAVPLIFDVTVAEEVDAAFRGIVEQEGRVDIVVMSAGGSARERNARMTDQSIEVIDEVLRVNLWGTILCARAAAQIMVSRGWGRIVAIGSSIGTQGKVGFSDYAAAKGGVAALVRSLAMELGEYGVTVNCVSPGIVERDAIGPARRAELVRTNVMNCIGTPEDVAHTVAWLVSEEAGFVTGQNVMVDGGRTLGLKGDG